MTDSSLPPAASSAAGGAKRSRTFPDRDHQGAARGATEAQRPISEGMLRRITRYSGTLSTDAVRALEEKLDFFADLSADQRAEIQLIIQSAVRDFVSWIDNPDAPLTDTLDGFKLLPKGVGHGLTLQQTVQVVRSTSEYFELVMPRVSHNQYQRNLMVAAVLKFGRELGFTAAEVYAAAAEERGAWDTRMEAMIVDAVVRGDRGSNLISGASALNFDPTAPAAVIVGTPRHDLGVAAVTAAHTGAVAAGLHALAVVQGARLVVILSADLHSALVVPHGVMAAFSDEPVVTGPIVDGLLSTSASAREALSGLSVVAGWPEAPRPVAADDLLPERILGGDETAAAILIKRVVDPLAEADPSLEETLRGYLKSGGHVEACARELFVHPNTVRYRLKRISQVTHLNPFESRDSFVLQIALGIGRIKHHTSQK